MADECDENEIIELDPVETTIAPDEDGLEHRRLELRKVRPDRRLDKYISGRLGKDHSRSAIQRYIREGNITVNGQKIKPSCILQDSDVIDMTLPEIRQKEIPPEPIPLDVLYEDDDLMAVNKQANLIVHPARGNWSGTLVNALAYYFKTNWRGTDISDLPNTGQVFRPGIVHRLDRDTTGIMLIAKSSLALWRLGHQFEHRQISKSYAAIVHGCVECDGDVIDAMIGKHPKVREKYAVHRKTTEIGKHAPKDAMTRYSVRERITNVGAGNAAFTLVDLFPKTGRTHQLRVHMSCIGHSVVADKMYGHGPVYLSRLKGSDICEDPLIDRQALHAATIKFRHPRTDEKMELSAPLPDDFTIAIERLQKLVN